MGEDSQNRLEVRVSLPQVTGTINVRGITILFGPPGSGKTWILKSIFGALYSTENKIVPSEFSLLRGGLSVSIRRGVEEVRLYCADESEGVNCSYEGYVGVSPLYVPSFAEAIIKYLWAPPYESYEEFRKLVIKYITRPTPKPSCDLSNYHMLVEKLGGWYRFKKVSVQLYELVDRQSGGELLIQESASTVARLGFLENAVGFLEEYDLLLLDDPEAGLHPKAVMRLAAFLHTLASCGINILVATHSSHFVDMLNRMDNIADIYEVKLETAPLSLYVVVDGKIKEYDLLSSYIEDYTEYLLAPYMRPEDYRKFLKSAKP